MAYKDTTNGFKWAVGQNFIMNNSQESKGNAPPTNAQNVNDTIVNMDLLLAQQFGIPPPPGLPQRIILPTSQQQLPDRIHPSGAFEPLLQASVGTNLLHGAITHPPGLADASGAPGPSVSLQLTLHDVPIQAPQLQMMQAYQKAVEFLQNQNFSLQEQFDHLKNKKFMAQFINSPNPDTARSGSSVPVDPLQSGPSSAGSHRFTETDQSWRTSSAESGSTRQPAKPRQHRAKKGKAGQVSQQHGTVGEASSSSSWSGPAGAGPSSSHQIPGPSSAFSPWATHASRLVGQLTENNRQLQHDNEMVRAEAERARASARDLQTDLQNERGLTASLWNELVAATEKIKEAARSGETQREEAHRRIDVLANRCTEENRRLDAELRLAVSRASTAEDAVAQLQERLDRESETSRMLREQNAQLTHDLLIEQEDAVGFVISDLLSTLIQPAGSTPAAQDDRSEDDAHSQLDPELQFEIDLRDALQESMDDQPGPSGLQQWNSGQPFDFADMYPNFGSHTTHTSRQFPRANMVNRANRERSQLRQLQSDLSEDQHSEDLDLGEPTDLPDRFEEPDLDAEERNEQGQNEEQDDDGDDEEEHDEEEQEKELEARPEDQEDGGAPQAEQVDWDAFLRRLKENHVKDLYNVLSGKRILSREAKKKRLPGGRPRKHSRFCIFDDQVAGPPCRQDVSNPPAAGMIQRFAREREEEMTLEEAQRWFQRARDEQEYQEKLGVICVVKKNKKNEKNEKPTKKRRGKGQKRGKYEDESEYDSDQSTSYFPSSYTRSKRPRRDGDDDEGGPQTRSRSRAASRAASRAPSVPAF